MKKKNYIILKSDFGGYFIIPKSYIKTISEFQEKYRKIFFNNSEISLIRVDKTEIDFAEFVSNKNAKLISELEYEYPLDAALVCYSDNTIWAETIDGEIAVNITNLLK
jgi:hypothetical protein